MRFKRWVRRMTIRAALILAVLGGATYFAWPHLPARTKQSIDAWIRRLPPPLGSGQGPH